MKMEAIIMDNKEKEILGKYQFWKNNPQQPNYGD